jgi:uncharacterized SAM-binding protein YcdF (DUF218 family)
VARRRTSLFLRVALILAAFLVLAVVTRTWWLRQIGYALIHEDAPVTSDIAVVLGGDPWGNRIEKGGDLVRAGYVPAALISGPPGKYGEHESEPEIAFAVRQGYPAAWFIAFPNEARSTEAEAAAILGELRRRDLHRILLVTSEYHTARAFRTYQKIARQMRAAFDMRTIGAPEPDFQADSWWRNREGQKITFLEWLKTVAATLGI